MDTIDFEVIDSQIIAEHVGFLDNCFDHTFTLQSSLLAVKDYVSEEHIEIFGEKSKGNLTCKTINHSAQNKTILELSTSNNSIAYQNGKVLNKNLKAWGLPPEIVSNYEQRGITEMFEWQVTCLSNTKVLMDCCNLVYSAPTSAGKTLVAEILTIKTILERQKKVIIILPFVSIVREKMFYLQGILSSSGIRVEGFMGSQSPPGGLQAVHLAICTIEKANSLVNRLLDEGNISELGAVIVDELHLLGDPHRGYILELLLTKIKYVSSKSDDTLIQIIGMSATLPNLEVLANWLSAELFVTEFRPIPLDEYCLVGNKYYDKHGKCTNSLDSVMCTVIENDNVLKICLETIRDGCSILIFCMTKNRCENVAQSLSSAFYKFGCEGGEIGTVLRKQLNPESITEVLEQLKNCPVNLDDILKRTISFGVAYHHAGLTFDERDIIEGAFKSGAIRVLVATSTLSSGVNLPARRVIIRTPVFQRQPINILTYKQMIGRAGRMGKDTKGESILICTETEKKIGLDLMMGALDPVKSCIESEDKYMRAVLEMIASQVLCTNEDLDLYSKCTLLHTQQDISKSQDFLLENTLKQLINFELVRIQNDGDNKCYVATPLGKACLSSSMAPNDGLSLFCELQRARQCLVLETDLHLIYLVTPYSVSSQWGDIDWLHMLTLWESLTRAMKRVGELVGVQESFIICCLRGTNKLRTDQNKLNIHKRFYTALALQDLVNEVPLYEVAGKFQCARGFLQSLQQAAATFAGMVTAFCRQLGWKNMEMLIAQFQDRLHFGIHSELLDLMKLRLLNGLRARTLFNSGYETIFHIASADVNIIENILHKTVPFQSEREREGDDSDDMRKRKKIKNIWITGCCGLTAREAAEKLIIEARKYLENEIGVVKIKWSAQVTNDSCNSNALDSENASILNVKEENVEKEINNCCYDTTTKIKEKTEIQKPDELNFITNNSSQIKRATENVYLSAHANECQYDEIEIKNKKSFTESSGDNNLKVENNFTVVHTVLDVIKSEITQIKCTDNVQNLSNDNSPSLLGKDDIVWDSLNFTEAAIENITKLRISDKMFSPNISFGDSDDQVVSTNQSKITENNTIKNNNIAETNKTVNNNIDSTSAPENVNDISFKSNSAKDISLFSSDGDNSSVFEESLPLDLIPSKLLHSKDSRISFCNQETTSNSVSINTNTEVNTFKSTLVETDEDEDIKLVYEEDDNKDTETSLNDLEVIDTQEVNETININNFASPYKRRIPTDINASQSLAKKRKMGAKRISKVKNKSVNGLKINSLPKINSDISKQFSIAISNHKLKCYVLKGNDVFDNLHVIENIHVASICLNIKNTILTSNEIIGSKILNINKTSFVEGNSCPLKGICIYIGQAICIYLDLSSLNSLLSLIKNKLCSWLGKKSIKLTTMSYKTNYVHLKRWLDIDSAGPYVDISLAEWLIDSEEKIPNIDYLTKKYCELDLSNMAIKINNRQKKYKNVDQIEDMCIKTWAIWMVAEKQEKYLNEHYKKAIDIEFQVSKILADCEYYGLAVDKDLASRLLIDVRNSQETLQKRAYKLCGYHFNFNSTNDVAKALGIYNGRRVSTKKSVLTSHNNTMSSIVIFWRKLNSILTKTLYPLTEKACIYTEGNRIRPSYTMYTCTGRISMHEPNLQNVPRKFSIPVQYLSINDGKSGEVIEFNCRNIFRAAPGYVLVSADYCQLEMRILTHFSEDEVLMKIMRSDVDVFKSIAASWSNVSEDEVDDDLRQKAKQLCYGILYGMGNKTLSQHLDVTEIEAAIFMDSFYKTYPCVKVFTQRVIDECRQKGYVETLTKRRRYLSDINSNLIFKRSAAERQAVNTTIQGSAADIAKAAMCSIDNRTNTCHPKPRLILQMHDELIYEVLETNKQYFVSTIKHVMEDTVKLTVPLPVKVKSGYTWGKLEEITL